ncbi:MAG TPA: ATP-binding protein [Thermoflexales bacterium]|nr:ATP-binding protein [Thermoflexales bacterium]
MIGRRLMPLVQEALTAAPVVILQGGRQTGKSTLASQLVAERGDAAVYLTLDDETAQGAARRDPQGFLRDLRGRNAVIDEAQRVPELFLPIKREVDEHRVPWRFLLTGSANALFLPRLAEALVGRAQLFTMWPLAQTEIESGARNLVDDVFAPELPDFGSIATSRSELARRIVRGGFPEAHTLTTARLRANWFRAYVTLLLQRDIRALSDVEGLGEMPALLSLLASRAANLVNVSDLGRSLGLKATTLRRYLSLFEATYLTRALPAWYVNLGNRVFKAPKILLSDTGLLCHLNNADETRLLAEPALLGQALENFAAMELQKLASWSDLQPALHHFRGYDGREVDVVLEARGGGVVGVEIKASESITDRDLSGLQALSDAAGKAFVRGIVLYTGAKRIALAPKLYAVPLSALWL